jgi:hypothetical protein
VWLAGRIAARRMLCRVPRLVGFAS